MLVSYNSHYLGSDFCVKWCVFLNSVTYMFTPSWTVLPMDTVFIKKVLKFMITHPLGILIDNNSALDGGDNLFGNIPESCERWQSILLCVPNNTVSQPSSIASNPLRVCVGETDLWYACIYQLLKYIQDGQ